MDQSIKSSLPIRSLLVILSIGFHGVILAIPLPPTPEPETKVIPAKPKPQKVAIANPKASTTPKPTITPSVAPSVTPSVVPPPTVTPSVAQTPPRLAPQPESVVTIPKANTSAAPSPSPSASPSASPAPSPSSSPSPSPSPVSFAGEVFGELGAIPGCQGKEGCWQVVGNWRQMVGDASPLMSRLRSQGYTISEYRSDDFLQVFALTKNRESRYLYILNSPEISPSGEQQTLTLIYNQGNLTQAEIEVLALNPQTPNN